MAVLGDGYSEREREKQNARKRGEKHSETNTTGSKHAQQQKNV